MKLPTVMITGLITTGCSSSSLMFGTQPAFTHKAPFLALSCERLRAIKSDPSTAALNGPLQILASRNTNATGQKDIRKHHQKAQTADDLEATVLGHQQAAAWALKVNWCE